MPNPSREQLERLPKWAQDHIRVLEMRLTEKQHDIDHLRQCAGETDVYRWIYGQVPQYIRDDGPITFRTRHGTVDVQLNQSRTAIVIYGGNENLELRASSANMFYVRPFARLPSEPRHDWNDAQPNLG